MAILIMGVEWRGSAEEFDSALQAPNVAKQLGIPSDRITEIRLIKRSLDARQRRKRWLANYRIELDRGEEELLARGVHGVRRWTERDAERYGLFDRATIPRQTWPSNVRPIVVGAGPAGLFAALRLAETGAKVLLIERGEPVEDRVPTVNQGWRNKLPLNTESNVVFGEGSSG